MIEILSYIQIANTVLCLLLAAQFLFMTAMRPIPKRLLSFNYVLYAHQCISWVAMFTGHGFWHTRLLVAMWFGPALYVYFVCVRRPESKLLVTDGWHFVLGFLLFALFYFVEPLRGLFEFAVIGSLGIYFLLIVLQVHRGRQAFAHLEGYAVSAYRWLISLMLLAFFNVFFEIAIFIEIRSGVMPHNSIGIPTVLTMFLLFNVSTMLAALYRSDWLEWMYKFGEQTLHQPASTIDKELAAALLQRWETLVKAENLHKQEFGITLTQAARKLQVPARQLSNAINQLYGKSFSAYLNDQRIQVAQHLLLAKPDMPIIEVMQESGFSSKSNFNKEFLRATGVSPSAYRES